MESFLTEIIRIAQAVSDQGWAEANAGNISVRLDEKQLADRHKLADVGPKQTLEVPVPTLDGAYFLVTAAGCHLRNIPVDPAGTCGVVRITDGGHAYQVLWGFQSGGRPTSEFFAHLLSHAVRKPHGERALIHSHPTTLMGLCHTRQLSTQSLTRLLWSMHPEGVCLFPDGIAYTPFMVAGTLPLANATCAAFEESGMVLWDFHGVFSSGRDLDHAYGKVQAAEKAAKIYQAACLMGGCHRVLSAEDIRAVSDSLGIHPLPGVLDDVVDGIWNRED